MSATDLATLSDPLPIEPVSRAFDVSIRPPGSKSLTNRALLMALLADGASTITGALTDADDAHRMLTAIDQLGGSVDERDTDTLGVTGTGGQLRGGCEVFLNNAGTATRFLTAAACFADGPVVIDGNARMRERPIGELVGLLRTLGVTIEELGEPGRVPIRMHPHRPAGGAIEVPTTLSSQFISALYMTAPLMAQGLTVHLVGEITSPSYLRMTLGLMERLGTIPAAWAEGDAGGRRRGGARSSDGLREVTVPGAAPIPAFRYDVEPDASGATYLWAAAAIVPGGRVLVPGLDGRSLQGDAGFVELLGRMGAAVEYEDGGTRVIGPERLAPIEADMSEMPDAAMTLGAVCCFASGPSELRGLRTLRVKETDRIAATKTELEKVGAVVEVFDHEGEGGAADEGMRITPPDEPCSGPPVVFDTYDDHRMAMSLALIGLRRAGVSIADPGCVRKTYAGYWTDVERLRSI
ncbi:MAG: 3-phosphoshikimate 1-carboxyvinyltransferase [Planctomycetota bacterium]